jgi:Uma2 family endonuclease
MTLGVSEQELMRIMDQAHDAGVKLEIHQGLPIWEFLPAPLYTMEATRIDRSVRKEVRKGDDCGCHSFQDMSIRFPDGSIRRPDISIYCEPPEPTQESTTSIPKAVVEVVSPGSEIKDIELSPPFYLLHGILDVLVFEPLTGVVAHFRREGRSQLNSPADVELECGCLVTV